MLKIPAFGMRIDCPHDYGLAEQNGVTLYAPLHGKFGVGITPPQPGDDPNGDLDDQFTLLSAIAPVGPHGATFLNRRDPQVPFLGLIKNPQTGQLYLLVPFNHAKLAELALRREIGKMVEWIWFANTAITHWEDALRGKTFTAADTYQRYIGSGEGYSQQEDLTFGAEGLYERRISGHTSISSGGLSLNRVRDERERGLWDLVEVDGHPVLRLDRETGERAHYSLSRTAETFFFDGQAFKRTR